jgi:transcriptional regulator with XRE-family HTH domain
MARITLARQVGLVVASARKAKGLTQSQLAHASGVSRQLVNRLETGAATGIALDKLLSVLNALGCTVDISPSAAFDLANGPANTHTSHASQAPVDLPREYTLDESLFDPRDGGAQDA